MSKNIITPEAGIAIIGQSLKQTNNEKTGASNYYIIWGALLFLFFITQFLGFHFRNEVSLKLAGWSMMLFPIGGILSFLQSKYDDKHEKLVPLNEKIYKFAWMGASLTLGVLCLGNMKNIPEMLCLGTLVIFGLINFIIGGVVKFKPFIVGGSISIILAVVVPQVTLDYKFLIASVGIFCSCLVPGLLMKRSEANV